MRLTAVALVSSLVFSLAIPAAEAGPLLKGGTTEASRYEDAMVTDCPQPKIPSQLKEQCFKTSCTARFVIEPDGGFCVKLVSSSGSQEVDDLVLSTLNHWKFRPAQLDGKCVRSSRKIRIVFEIE